MRRDVKEALAALEDVLLRGGSVSADLAAILSALRGPDGVNDGSALKWQTTDEETQK